MMAGQLDERPRHQRADDQDKGEAGGGQGRNKVKDKGTRSKRKHSQSRHAVITRPGGHSPRSEQG
jgi:hypothetical protein